MKADAIKVDLPCVGRGLTQCALFPPAVDSQVKQKSS